MPIPAPSKGETREKFVARCMGNEVMMTEFKDNKQRLAVCFSKWKSHSKETSSDLATDNVESLIEAFLQRHPELIIKEEVGD